MRDSRLTIVPRVGVDLPVLLDGVTSDQDAEDNSDVSDCDENVGDADADVHVDEAGPITIHY